MNYLALDIGGANLKVADGYEFARSHPFAMWRNRECLTAAIQDVLRDAPPCDHLAVTMTGELADCFASRAEGVREIVQATERAAAECRLSFYRVDGCLVGAEYAVDAPLQIASANWHALAAYCARLSDDRSALLLDIGSTTVDLVPIWDGRPAGRGSTDSERLMAGELIYTGVERSPVCALVRTLPLQGGRYPVVQEVFATSRDAHLLLGNLPEQPDDCCTADGQPATRSAALRRLARMLCLDAHQLPECVAEQWAREIADAQLELIGRATRRVLHSCVEPPTTVVVSGHGHAIAQRLFTRIGWTGRSLFLHEELGEALSRCATAHALAVLVRERAPGTI